MIYTSDHGESMGRRGLWGKFTMYEESVAVPLIVAGPGVPEGGVSADPVSLVDAYPTILEAVGVPLAGRRSATARPVAVADRGGTPVAPRRVQRIPRRRVHDRVVHAPQRTVQARVLRRLSAAALRSRGGSRRVPGSGRVSPTTGPW